MNVFSLTKGLLAGAALFTLAAVEAAEQAPQVLFDKNQGAVTVYHAFENPTWGAAFRVQHYDAGYKPMKGFVFDGAEMEGRLTTADDSRVPVKIQYTQKSPDAVHAKLTVETEEPFSTGRLMYEQFMRFVPGVGVKVTVHGKEFDYSKPFDSGKPYQIVIPALPDNGVTTVVVDAPKASWTLTGKFAVILQDLRNWKSDALQLRLMFTPYSGQLTKSSLEFDLALKKK